MEAILAPKKQANQTSPEGMYWVFTRLGASVLGTIAGAVISNDPYTAPDNWVRQGYVTPEELE